jgi:hypothetical protein
MARRRNVGAVAGRKGGLKFPPPSGPWGALQALMDDGGQITLGAISGIPGATVATRCMRLSRCLQTLGHPQGTFLLSF